MVIDAKHLYKAETGQSPGDEEEIEFEVWRSKGQWILNISDEEKFKLAGNMGFIRFNKPDYDYIKWLENKVMELIKSK